MVAHLKRRPRRYGFGLLAMAFVIIALLYAVRPSERALATSGGDPYSIPVVTDTNPDPNIVETTLVAEDATVDIGNGVMANAETFNGAIPGPEFQLKVGDTVIVHFENHLSTPTGIHWHGIELDNSSDGTPLTQNQVPAGGTFLYKFKVSRPGIFWYHPHHHSSTNQVFKGMFGPIVVTDPNEAALEGSGVIPPPSQTLTLAISDTTVCKAPGHNDAATYDPSLPWVGGGPLPAQPGPTPVQLCETSPIDEDGNPLPAGSTFGAGDIPNIQGNTGSGRTNEGQTVLTNGMNVGGRAGSPSAPGALAPGAATFPVQAGEGLRMRIGNTAAIRFLRLRLTDSTGAQIPLVRIGGEGGLLDHAVVEGGSPGGFDTGYDSGEILLDPGSRADVVAAIPPTATGVLTLWTEDYNRTGAGFSDLPTVPVAHLQVTGTAPSTYTISDGTALRAATGDLVPALGPATGTLLDPSTFSPAKPGMASQEIKLTNASQTLGIDGVKGPHDLPGDYTTAPHFDSARYAKLGDTLELQVTNTTGSHHPFHLHGFSMQPISLTKSGSPSFVWPYHEFRDNIDVPPGYTLTFRIKLTDRPLADGTTMGGGLGRWMFHCHIFFHATNGMISELDVVNADGNEKPDVNANVTKVEVHHGDTATVHGTYHDPDGDPVTLSASIGSVSDDGGGNWTWTYTTTGADTTQFVYITATDSKGNKDQALFQLKFANTPPTLHLPGPQSQDYHDSLSFGISATDPDVGDTVSLSASGLPAGLTFTDNGDRTGTVSGKITAAPGPYTVTFSADDHQSASPTTGTVTITVTREETTTVYTGPTAILQGASGVTLAATLLEDGTAATDPTEQVTLALGGQSCVGTTDATTGIASCTITFTGALGPQPLSATFAGDTYYVPSSDTGKTAIVFAFPSRGAFTLGDVTAGSAGSSKVTWWADTWSQLNKLTGGAAPSSDKGFAGVITLPTSTPPVGCGSAWTTTGGNSPPPVSGIPSYMGVVVTSSVTKSGTTISGNSVHIVVVKTNAGYAPTPDHPGTGTIVANYC
jgi:FtsP/CotA-like multicopper oxidase with cupredoxin domain